MSNMDRYNRKIEGLTQLIERAKKGDPDDLEELYERFKPLIMKATKKMAFPYREDAKQDLIVELYEAIQRFEPNTDWGKKEVCRYNAKSKKVMKESP